MGTPTSTIKQDLLAIYNEVKAMKATSPTLNHIEVRNKSIASDITNAERRIMDELKRGNDAINTIAGQVRNMPNLSTLQSDISAIRNDTRNIQSMQDTLRDIQRQLRDANNNNTTSSTDRETLRRIETQVNSINNQISPMRTDITTITTTVSGLSRDIQEIKNLIGNTGNTQTGINQLNETLHKLGKALGVQNL